ncbi:MAG: hypothetical protein ASARMPREDX12_009617 [Alectoria sarmentosa]|nr:MAG: hypothetical protein ASARMPREDX12_009617 [Alectoria sarmentosa]
MPPAPFEFVIPNTDFLIIFTNYGGSIVTEDAGECVSEAMLEIKHEIDTHWTHIDIPISGNLVFTSGSAQLKLNTGPLMWRTYCLHLTLGVSQWGHEYGYIEVNMQFVQRSGRARRTLGTGSLLLSNAAS